MAEQLELTGLGYVIFEWKDSQEKDHRVRWRRPNLREYRELRNLLQELGRKTQGLREELGVHLDAMTEAEAAEDGDYEPDWAAIDELRDQIADYMIPWLQKGNEMLKAEGSLPEDIGEWAAWMASPSLPTEITTHYRSVPKAPGEAGTNSPRAT